MFKLGNTWTVEPAGRPTATDRETMRQISDPNHLTGAQRGAVGNALKGAAWRLSAGKAVAVKREKIVRARIESAREDMERAQRQLERMEALSNLYVSTQLVFEEDSDGSTGIERDALLSWMAQEIDDAPENIEDDLNAAIFAGELQQMSDGKLFLTRQSFNKLGFAGTVKARRMIINRPARVRRAPGFGLQSST